MYVDMYVPNYVMSFLSITRDMGISIYDNEMYSIVL